MTSNPSTRAIEASQAREELKRVKVSIQPEQISSAGREVVRVLQDAGHEAYLVGGCIRDALLAITPKDFDVATSATPDEVKGLFRKCRLIGRRFRLAHIFVRGELIEVATFRKAAVEAQSSKDSSEESDDEAIDASAQDQQSCDQGILTADNAYGSLNEDIVRRDFTVNALYLDPFSMEIIDEVDGLQDLENRCIRLIGDPQVRFREDPVRILRALRFSAKLDFNIDPVTAGVIPTFAPLLNEIPKARLFEELQKLFISAYAKACFDKLVENDILKYLLPQTNIFLQYEPIRKMLDLALENTSARIRKGKNITPSFLLAIFLWGPVRAWQQHFRQGGSPAMLALHRATQQVVYIQAESTALPKRFTGPMQDIFELQERLCKATRKNAFKTLQHRRFRAAFDFLVIREMAGDIEPGIARWWLDLQTADKAGQQAMLKSLRSGQSRRR